MLSAFRVQPTHICLLYDKDSWRHLIRPIIIGHVVTLLLSKEGIKVGLLTLGEGKVKTYLSMVLNQSAGQQILPALRKVVESW